MANFAITSKVIENKDINALVAEVETYIETLDSTNDPIASIQITCNPQSGMYFAVIITT